MALAGVLVSCERDVLSGKGPGFRPTTAPDRVGESYAKQLILALLSQIPAGTFRVSALVSFLQRLPEPTAYCCCGHNVLAYLHPSLLVSVKFVSRKRKLEPDVMTLLFFTFI